MRVLTARPAAFTKLLGDHGPDSVLAGLAQARYENSTISRECICFASAGLSALPMDARRRRRPVVLDDAAALGLGWAMAVPQIRVGVTYVCAAKLVIPLPSSVKSLREPKGRRRLSLSIQFSKADDQRFWFYNSCIFRADVRVRHGDGGGGLLRTGAANTGCMSADHARYRSPNHQWRVYIAQRVTIREIVRRTASSRSAPFITIRWESLYAQ